MHFVAEGQEHFLNNKNNILAGKKMFLYITIIVSIIGLLIATYTDLKERIVANKLNFSLAIIGLVIYALQSIWELNWAPITFSFLGLGFGFGFGWLLWKAGVFAGGDVKLFMALGALNPFTPALIQQGYFATAPLPLFPITLFICSLIAFLPYGIGMAFYKLFKNKEHRKKVGKDLAQRSLQGIHVSIMAAGLYILLGLWGVNLLWAAPILLLWGLTRKWKMALTIIVALAALYFNAVLFIEGAVGMAIVVVLLYGLARVMFSLRPLLSVKVKVKDLEEGMIPAKSLVWRGKKVVEAPALTVSNIIKYAKQQRLYELAPKKEIISARKACGLTEKEVREVKRLAKKGLIGKELLIKESMPFVPTVLIGYVICLGIGDAILFLFLGGVM